MTEKLNIPKTVIDSDWKDDIDYEPYGTNKQEREYISPSNVSKESIDKIKSAKIFQNRGAKILNLFKSERTLA